MSELNKPFIKLRNESGSEDMHYSLVYDGFPEQFKLMAERELNETEELQNQGLQKLKDFVKKKNTNVLEDYLLLSVLRACKYNFEKSKAKLEKFVTKRREIIEMVAEIETKKIEYIVDDCVIGMLPYRDKNGRAIIYSRPYGVKKEGQYDIHDVSVISVVFLLFLIKFPISSVAGFCYFGECKSPSRYIFLTALKAMRKLTFTVLAFPLRISKVEVMNENHFCRPFMKVMSPFVGKKIVSRISFNGSSYDNLHRLYNPDILPEEFGGNLGPVNDTVYKQMLLAFIEDMKKEIR